MPVLVGWMGRWLRWVGWVVVAPFHFVVHGDRCMVHATGEAVINFQGDAPFV